MLRMQNFLKRMNTCIVEEVLIEWTVVVICILLRKYSEPESKNGCRMLRVISILTHRQSRKMFVNY